jgi:flagellar biosynthesis chaperone FliJ
MAVSRAMRRLLRVLHIQEEQSRTALESAVAQLRRLEQAQTANDERGRSGRHLVTASALHGQIVRQLVDRLAGLEETLAASRAATVLAAYTTEAEERVAERREEFLARRIERRQAEALVKRTEAADTVEAGRRSQRTLDDWYLNRLHRTHVHPGAERKSD